MVGLWREKIVGLPQIGKDLSEEVEAFFSMLLYQRRSPETTCDSYSRDLRQFFLFLSGHLGHQLHIGDLASLTVSDFRSFVSERRRKNLSGRSVARGLSAIRVFFRYLESKGHLDTTALSLLRSPKIVCSLPRSLPHGEVRNLLSLGNHIHPDCEPWVGARDVAVLTLLYGCGLRISEALSLDGKQAPLRAEHRVLRILGKGRKTREVPVLEAVREAISRYVELCPYRLDPETPLFRGVRGGRLSPRVVQLAVAGMREFLALPESVTPHALRHAFATHLLTSSGDLRAVQDLLGHESLSSTQVYTEVDRAQMLSAYQKFHPRA